MRGQQNTFRISGTSQAYFGSFKDSYLHRCYCKECLYSHISLKVWDDEEKSAFLLRLPLRQHIATFSVDSGILISLYASVHHPHTTLATGEWIILFEPAKIVPLKSGPLSIAAICFWDTFNSFILNNVDKFCYLGSFLTELALEVITGLTLSAAN